MFWAVHLQPSGAQLTFSLPFKLTPTSLNHEHWLTQVFVLLPQKKKNNNISFSSPSIPDWVIPLTLISPFTIRRCHPFSSFFTHVVLSSPRIPPSSRYDLASPLYTNSTHFYLLSASIFLPSFLPSWPAWAYCPARRSHSFCPRFPFSLSLPLFLPHLFSPSTPAFPLRFPSPPPLLSLKVFAQSGLAQRGSTFCRYHPKWLPAAMSDASCCALPLLFCHHCALLL